MNNFRPLGELLLCTIMTLKDTWPRYLSLKAAVIFPYEIYGDSRDLNMIDFKDTVKPVAVTNGWMAKWPLNTDFTENSLVKHDKLDIYITFDNLEYNLCTEAPL